MAGPCIHPLFSSIVDAGRTHAFPAHLSPGDARPWWMEQPPSQTVVAVDGETMSGSAVHLWQGLGFRILSTVPEAFDHPAHELVGLHVMVRR